MKPNLFMNPPFAGKMDRILKRPLLWPELYRSPGGVVNSFSA
jgi:hypothetical protein